MGRTLDLLREACDASRDVLRGKIMLKVAAMLKSNTLLRLVLRRRCQRCCCG